MTDFYDTRRAAEGAVAEIEERIGSLSKVRREAVTALIKNALDGALIEVYDRGRNEGERLAKAAYGAKLNELKQLIRGWE